MKSLVTKNFLQQLINAVNLINLASALFIVVLAIFGETKLQNITRYVFFISFGLEVILEQRWRNFAWDRKKWVFVAFLLFFALIYIYLPFEETTKHIGKITEYRLPFLAFGIIGLLGVNKLYKLKYFAVTILVTCIATIFYIVFYRIGITEFISRSDRAELFSFARVQFVNSHMIFNYYLNVALVLTYYLFYVIKNKWIKPLLIFFILVIYSILLLSEGRAGFIASNVLLLIMIIYEIWKRGKTIAVIVAVLLLGAVGGLIYNHDKIAGHGNNIGKDPRLVIWKQAVEVITDKPVFGYGASTGNEVFMDKITNNVEIIQTGDATVLHAVEIRRILCAHSHCQYLHTTIEFGVIGLLVLLFFNIAPIFVADRKRRLFVFLFVLVNIVQLASDIYVSAIPLTIFALLLTVFLSKENDKSLKQNLLSS
ncbi:MAG: O-antigen ligase family protein [Prevotellaceae bacterium]|jgi:O-antigen ligase|nr:O-antigen ligase family protein [Prevotellaceae bacterium]